MATSSPRFHYKGDRLKPLRAIADPVARVAAALPHTAITTMYALATGQRLNAAPGAEVSFSHHKRHPARRCLILKQLINLPVLCRFKRHSGINTPLHGRRHARGLMSLTLQFYKILKGSGRHAA